jgi:hypothetical protein
MPRLRLVEAMVEAQFRIEISNSSRVITMFNEMGELKEFRVGPDRGRCKGIFYISIDAHWTQHILSTCGHQCVQSRVSRVNSCALALPPSRTKVESVAGAVAGRVPQVAGCRRGGRSEGPAFPFRPRGDR